MKRYRLVVVTRGRGLRRYGVRVLVPHRDMWVSAGMSSRHWTRWSARRAGHRIARRRGV